MRVIKKLNDGFTVFQYDLTAGDLLTCGSVPISLPGINWVPGNYIYLPVQAVLLCTSIGSTNYDFGASDHPLICTGGLNINKLFQWYDPLQTFQSTDISISTPVQRTHNNITMGRDPYYKPLSNQFVFTTATGNDATQGDGKFTLYITAYRLNLN